jgi:integrase
MCSAIARAAHYGHPVSWNILNEPLRRVGLKTRGVGGHAYRRAFNDTLRRNARGYDLERRLILGHSIERDINASRYSTVTLAELAHVVTAAYRDDPILPSIAMLLPPIPSTLPSR